MGHISWQNMILFRKWSMQHRHRLGDIQPLGQDKVLPFWSSPAQFPVALPLWALGSCMALNSPQILLSFFLSALLTTIWNSRGGLQLCPALPFPQILPPLCTAVRPSLEPSLCVEMTQFVAHERATGPLTNITATILICLPLFGKTDTPCSI